MGMRGHRAEFDKMLARAKADREINAILVHDYSRFSRDSLGARVLVRELRQAGIRVISLNDLEVDSETVAGVYMEAITFAKNEAYSRGGKWHSIPRRGVERTSAPVIQIQAGAIRTADSHYGDTAPRG